jgi:hypothetical protein
MPEKTWLKRARLVLHDLCYGHFRARRCNRFE